MPVRTPSHYVRFGYRGRKLARPIKNPWHREVSGIKFRSSDYLFVLALLVLGLAAGGEDISPSFEQPINNAETAAITNISFFISVYPFYVNRILRCSDSECKPAERQLRNSPIPLSLRRCRLIAGGTGS